MDTLNRKSVAKCIRDLHHESAVGTKQAVVRRDTGAVVQYQEHLAPRFWLVTQSAVHAGDLGYVVVLNEATPRPS